MVSCDRWRLDLKYQSTRGQAPVLEFEDAVLAGLARDGGLYVPETWPKLEADQLRALQGASYADIAYEVIAPFVGDAIAENDLRSMIADSYADFGHPAVAPLRQLDSNSWLLELFHGPTLAFKDFALQLLGRLFDHILAKRHERVTIVGATSGDTGSAAIEACRDRDAIDIFILHPEGRVSDIQRRQMTTVASPNVFNIAIDGTFDDCQDLVKAMFNDEAFRDEMKLSAVNSINWARIMAQVVYYVSSAVALGAPDRRIAFSVPTGNFGDVFAGYVASKIGLPIDQLLIATNANDILARFFETGEMSMRPVKPTLAPAMDIQVSSNFERLMFDLNDCDGRIVSQSMASFRDSGSMRLADEAMESARALFDAVRLDDKGISAVIDKTWRDASMVIDPHTATAVYAARQKRRNSAVPMVVLGTAHPAKFLDAVEEACGLRPRLPERLAEMMNLPEHVRSLPNDLAKVQDFIRDRAALTSEASQK
jgi:threonine synthase